MTIRGLLVNSYCGGDCAGAGKVGALNLSQQVKSQSNGLLSSSDPGRPDGELGVRGFALGVVTEPHPISRFAWHYRDRTQLRYAVI